MGTDRLDSYRFHCSIDGSFVHLSLCQEKEVVGLQIETNYLNTSHYIKVEYEQFLFALVPRAGGKIKRAEKNYRAKSGDEFSPPVFARPYFPVALFRFSLEGLFVVRNPSQSSPILQCGYYNRRHLDNESQTTLQDANK